MPCGHLQQLPREALDRGRLGENELGTVWRLEVGQGHSRRVGVQEEADVYTADGTSTECFAVGNEGEGLMPHPSPRNPATTESA